MPPLDNKVPAFCHPWENFYNLYCCFTLVAKGRSSQTFVELNLGFRDKLESSTNSSHILYYDSLTDSLRTV